MISFAFIDANGLPTGGGVRRELPPGAVALPAPWTTADLRRLRWQDGVWVERTDIKPAPPPSAEELAARAAAALATARADAVARVNAAVDAARRRVYTDIAGQDALYLEKRAEAVRFVAFWTEPEMLEDAGPDALEDFPLLANEVGITAPTAWQLAQIWLHRSDQFKQVGAATERLRMRAIHGIETAGSEAEIDTLSIEFTEALSRLPI